MAHVFLLMLSLTGCTLEGALYLLLCLMTSVALPGEGSSATGAASRFSKEGRAASVDLVADTLWRLAGGAFNAFARDPTYPAMSEIAASNARAEPCRLNVQMTCVLLMRCTK
jgi:hypothetical protein